MGIRWNREGHSKHRVTEIDWINGELRELVNEFESLAQAHEYARNSNSQTVKLYDGWGQLLMQTLAPTPSAAADNSTYGGYSY
jgi:hypothetical protein